MRVLTVLILGILLIVCNVNGSVVLDEALTANLQDVSYEDKFIVALSNIKVKKKSSTSNSIETLLAVKYKQTKIKKLLIIDRRMKRVILENLDENGQRSVAYVNVDSLAMNTPVKSLIILVHQTFNARMDVYVDCVYEGSMPLMKTFRDIVENENNPLIEVFRERKCQAKVYHSSINEALKKEHCSDNLIDMKQPSIFENEEQLNQKKTYSTDFNQKKKPTERPEVESDKINNESNTSTDQNNLNHHLNNKKLSDKKDHRNHPNDDRHKKKDHSRPGNNNKSDEYDSNNSFDLFSQSDQLNETDDIDYPKSSSPSLHSATGYHFIKHPKKLQHQSGHQPIIRPKKLHQTSSRLEETDEFDELNLFSISNESDKFGSLDNLNRLSRSPNRPRIPDGFDYSDTDMSGKRIPKRGDIGIQSLDEKICNTDDQIVKTLNELINVTRKLGREVELNRQETQYLRQLIENCSACRTPIGE